MQDDESKIEDQPIVTEPVAEVTPSPEPQPEQVSEVPVVEPIPEPVIEPTPPEQITEPTPEPQTPPPTPEPEPTPIVEPTPPVAPETPPVASVPLQPPTVEQVTPEPVPPIEPTPEQPKEEPVVASPTPQSPEPAVVKDGIPQKVLDLTPEELDAARRLWASQTIHDTQKKSVQARKDRVEQNMQRVEHFVKKYGPTTVRTVGLELGMSTRSASSYLIDLSKKGKIQATGQTTTRRYS